MIILNILAVCVILFFLAIYFSSKPYPKEWEEEENKNLEKKFKDYNKENQD